MTSGRRECGARLVAIQAFQRLGEDTSKPEPLGRRRLCSTWSGFDPIGFRPSSRVPVRLVSNHWSLILFALIVRCYVSALDPEGGIKYRGALQFDERCADLTLARRTRRIPARRPL
jgi:hypothetical protein